MSTITVTRAHLAGLELALASMASYCAGSKADAECVLSPLIAQASAAPEQEAVAWMHTYRCYPDDPRAPNQSGYEVTDFHQNPKAPGIESHTPLYTHPSAEIERLRAELDRGERHRNDQADKIVEQRTEIGATRQKLAEAQALLRKAEGQIDYLATAYENLSEDEEGECFGHEVSDAREVIQEIDDFLSAAKPAEVKS